MPPRLIDLQSFLVEFIDLFYALGGLFFLVLLVVIGFQWLTSAGSEETLQEVRQRLNYWLIGFLLFFLSAAIVSFIYDTLNVEYCDGVPARPGFNIIFPGACP
jgi:cytochrome bd-type quinol oxidase subunit 2